MMTPSVTTDTLLCGTLNAEDIPETDTIRSIEGMVKMEVNKVDKLHADQWDASWTPFVAGVGVWLIDMGYECHKHVAQFLANMIVNEMVSIQLLKCYSGDNEADFKERFSPGPVRGIAHSVYARLLKGKRPAPTPTDVLQKVIKRPARALEMKQDQASPSDLSKLDQMVVTGIGHFDVGRIVTPGSVISKLLPGPEVELLPEVQDIAISLTKLVRNSCAIPNEEKDGVQQLYNLVAGEIGFSQQQNVKYSILGSPTTATKGGQMDGSIAVPSVYNSNELWGMAVWENMGGAISTSSGLRQGGAAYGFGIATFLRGLGFDASEVLVPVILCNGTQIQFACVYMLQPSFPVFSLVSVPFSLSNNEQRRKAAAFVVKAKEIAKANYNRVIDLIPKDGRRIDLSKIKMLIDQDLYHFKGISQLPERGVSSSYGCSQMFVNLSLLSDRLDDQDMKLIVFPLAVRVDDYGQESLVFDKIDHVDYEGGRFHVGLPDPNTDDWEKWLLAVEEAFYIIHNKGRMVHVDPYPSNIMWRHVVGGVDVEVKIIDWDVVHEVGEDWAPGFMRRVIQLAENRRACGWSFTNKVSPVHDQQYLRVLRGLDVTNEAHKEICQDLASGDVGKINDAFRTAAAMIDIREIDLLGYR